MGLAFQVCFWCSFQVKIKLKEKTSIYCEYFRPKIIHERFPQCFIFLCIGHVIFNVKHTCVASAGPTVTVLVEGT